MLSNSPNVIAICQLTQRVVFFFPPMCEKKKHTVLSQNVLHATEIVAIFSWEKILEEKASVSYVYHAME